jgi:hypothetical protein
MKTKNIIWGLILVLIGVLFILKNLDIIYFSWYSLWRLWPLMLVLIGVSILPIKEGIKIVLTIIVLIAAGFFLVSYPASDNWTDHWFFNHDREQVDNKEPEKIDQKIFEAYDTTITEADLIFDAAAGNFRIEQPTEELFEFEREGNLGKYNYSLKNLGEKREIRIELNEGRVIRGDLRNKVAMKLNPNPLWNLNVDVGAASIDMDLTSFKIGKLDISGGASSINIVIGSLQKESKIKINSGASSINIKVPKDFACEVNTSTVLSSKDLPGFNKVGGGTYITPEFSDKTKNIVIDIEAAVSSLSIERY